MSVTLSEAIPVKTTLFTVNENFLVDALYVATIVNHVVFCTINSCDDIDPTVVPALRRASCTAEVVDDLPK